jgi:hypothetical protein
MIMGFLRPLKKKKIVVVEIRLGKIRFVWLDEVRIGMVCLQWNFLHTIRVM